MQYPAVLLFGAVVSSLVHAEVTVTGTEAAVTDIVSGYLEPELKKCSETSQPPLDRLRARARDALDALGYFQGTTTLEWQAPCHIAVAVTPGKLSTIQAWHVQLLDPSLVTRDDTDWITKQTASRGSFKPDRYETVKRRVLATLKDRGYVDVNFETSEVVVDTGANTAEITWELNTGPQYIVRNVIVEQQTLDERLFRKYLQVAPGKPLATRDVLSSYENLVASDYYSRVRVAADMASRAEGEIDVKVTASRVDPWSVLGGVGFATDSGPRVRAQANARYLNERGHRLNVSSLLSPVLGDAKAEYRWPYGDPTHQWYSVETAYNYENTDTAKSDTFTLGLRRVTRLGRRWTYTAYTDLLNEKFDVSTQEGRSQLWLIGSNLSYTSAADSARPRHGRSVSFDIRGAHSALLSDNDIMQVRVQGKQIVPFFGGSRWLFRAEIGSTWQAEFQNLPASLRFFAGGDKSVRGFALESLGPKDDLGEVIGGERLLVASAELDVPVRENWSVAFFTDVGSAYNQTPEFSQSVGFGVRWYSPLGPIRLDLAHPLEDSSQAVRLHISIGPDL